MDAQAKSWLNESEQNLFEIFSMAHKYGDDASKSTDTYLSIMEKICQLNEEGSQFSRAYEKSNGIVNKSKLEEILQTTLRNVDTNKQDYKKSKAYKDFAKQLDAIIVEQCGVEEQVVTDEFVMESEINIYDPLTKQCMQEPMKNNKCGHHYEKTSIYEAINMNKKLRCPVAGCGNKNYVKKTDLVYDPILKEKINHVLSTQNA